VRFSQHASVRHAGHAPATCSATTLVDAHVACERVRSLCFVIQNGSLCWVDWLVTNSYEWIWQQRRPLGPATLAMRCRRHSVKGNERRVISLLRLPSRKRCRNAHAHARMLGADRTSTVAQARHAPRENRVWQCRHTSCASRLGTLRSHESLVSRGTLRSRLITIARITSCTA